MEITRRDFLKDMAFTAAIAGVPSWAIDLDEKMPASVPWQWSPSNAIGQGNAIITTLNRIAFGPRPAISSVCKALASMPISMSNWRKIDDSAFDQRLAQLYPTLSMSAAELFEKYPQPAPGTKPPPETTPQQVISELQEATLMRALFSRRQLQETLVDFWTNHFNIFIGKSEVKWLKTVDDREVIRKNAFGKFKDLLLASAQSPAMLVYLDNSLNVKGVANENYAREIMELHTLGADGGYTQKDVAELARAFTGWGITLPRRRLGVLDATGAGIFEFDPKKHDDAAKRILGIDLPAKGGINDALKMIDVLARHPSTARFISTKLVARYVSDNPPAALVQRAADTFTKSDGDIRQVLGTILHSDEFKNSFAQKIKRPFETIVSALRVVDARLEDTRSLAQSLRAMGQGLFLLATPDGYSDVGVEWINTTSLLARWNLALMVGANRVPRGKIDFTGAMKELKSRKTGDVIDYWLNYVLHYTIPEKDRQKLIDVFDKNASANFDVTRAPELVALILASPHFQYR